MEISTLTLFSNHKYFAVFLFYPSQSISLPLFLGNITQSSIYYTDGFFSYFYSSSIYQQSIYYILLLLHSTNIGNHHYNSVTFFFYCHQHYAFEIHPGDFWRFISLFAAQNSVVNHTMEYYSAPKKNEVLVHAMTWRKLGNIMLRHRKLCIIAFYL